MHERPFTMVPPRTMDSGAEMGRNIIELHEWTKGANERWDAREKARTAPTQGVLFDVSQYDGDPIA